MIRAANSGGVSVPGAVQERALGAIETIGRPPLSESLQDYLEVVYLLAQRHGVARMKEIAALVGVGKSSVTGAIRALAARGFVHYEPYQYVTLTPRGEETGRGLLRRHRFLKQFLMTVLGVPEEEAETVGCKIEHAIKGDVLDRFVRFLHFVEERSASDGVLAEALREFRRMPARPRGKTQEDASA